MDQQQNGQRQKGPQQNGLRQTGGAIKSCTPLSPPKKKKNVESFSFADKVVYPIPTA